ncbi:MAG: acetyl-CoA carboxylase biotin carboxyl carrier protein subunit [Streptococcaceae bacterium]|jgi:biotin carboxyl carrier protein|nr:acetyl-CoA carboxylase biotin carboxyl carrier protein subunit [Streptococcaceae bacterium]
MLRKFKIRIDGKEYQVEMEEEGTPQVPLQSAPAVPAAPAAPAPVAPTAPVAPAAPASPAGADAIKAPMPGAILKILVNIGDHVEENQPLMILEAMKMENQIVADKAGTVSAIHVTVGNQVNPGEALITLA